MARFYPNEIADELKRILKTATFASSVKVFSKGSLDAYPTPETLSDWLDAIIVKSLGFKPEFGPATRDLTVTYRYLIVYIRQHVAEEVIETTNNSRWQEICDLLIDNVGLDDPLSELYTYINGGSASLSVIHCWPTSIEIEDEAKVSFRDTDSVDASVIGIEVEVETKVNNAL